MSELLQAAVGLGSFFGPFALAWVVAGRVDRYNERRIIPEIQRPTVLSPDDDVWLAEQEQLISEGREYDRRGILNGTQEAAGR